MTEEVEFIELNVQTRRRRREYKPLEEREVVVETGLHVLESVKHCKHVDHLA